MKTSYPSASEAHPSFQSIPDTPPAAPSVAGYWAALGDRRLRPAAIRVALVVGTLLFTINHGSALAQGNMSRDRWLSGLLTYLVPYSVNIHGQYISRMRSHDR